VPHERKRVTPYFIFIAVELKSYPQVIHRLSTGYPHMEKIKLSVIDGQTGYNRVVLGLVACNLVGFFFMGIHLETSIALFISVVIFGLLAPHIFEL